VIPAALVAAGVGVAGVGALAYASLVEVRWYTLREFTVPVLPPGQAPLRILHIADLHLTPSQHRKIDWVRDLASLKPDLVVDTGDNFGHMDSLGPLLHALEPLLGTPGAFVMGSNDYVAPAAKNPVRYLLPDSRTTRRLEPPHLPARELAAALTGAGWRDVDNRRDDIVLADGRRISVVGVDDAHMDRDRFPARVASHVEPHADLRVGVTHAPYRRVLDAMLDDDADLILAGHTHGGQLAMPFFGALVTNCDLDRRRAKGLHGWPGARPDSARARAGRSTWLHVSAGLGTSPFAPVRFACRPEATLLTLVGR
jgi:predicted MPP superfamily phosphohydrolase